jgi:hypothetical protein
MWTRRVPSLSSHLQTVDTEALALPLGLVDVREGTRDEHEPVCFGLDLVVLVEHSQHRSRPFTGVVFTAYTLFARSPRSLPSWISLSHGIRDSLMNGAPHAAERSARRFMGRRYVLSVLLVIPLVNRISIFARNRP